MSEQVAVIARLDQVGRVEVAIAVRVDGEMLEVAVVEQLVILLGCENVRQLPKARDVLLELIHLLLQSFVAGF